MSSTDVSCESGAGTPPVKPGEVKLPVDEEYRVVQVTPPGSAGSTIASEELPT